MLKFFGVVALFVLPQLAAASCLDAPMWRGEPLTPGYIEHVRKTSDDLLRVKHLEILLASSTEGRRKNALLRLIPRALLNYKGNRGELGRKMRSGDVRELVPLLEIKSLPLSLRIQLATLYWVNGCVEEAVKFSKEIDRPNSGTSYYPMAVADSSALMRFAKKKEYYSTLRLRTFGELIDRPDKAESLLSSFKNYLYTSAGTPVSELVDQPGLDFALAALQGSSPPAWPAKPENSDQVDIYVYYARMTAIAVWGSLIGQCAEVNGLFIKLLMARPALTHEYWRDLAEASALRCGMIKQ